MNHTSEITYWLDNESFTTPAISIPRVGEVIHFNTRVDDLWLSTHFPQVDIDTCDFQVRGSYIVESVERNIRTYDTKIRDTVGGTVYEFPARHIVENFEVQLVPQTKD